MHHRTITFEKATGRKNTAVGTKLELLQGRHPDLLVAGATEVTKESAFVAVLYTLWLI